MDKSLEELVRRFLSKRGSAIDESVALVKRQPTLRAAVVTAVLACHPDMKKHSHQFRIPMSRMRATLRSVLKHTKEIAAAKNFDQLHEIVRRCRTFGYGELAVYDAAHRIGAYRRITPTIIYLHRGTRDGARSLGLDVSSGVARMHELPRALRRLTAAQAEDFLCMYKRALKRLEKGQ
jgi:hypothetical protein